MKGKNFCITICIVCSLLCTINVSLVIIDNTISTKSENATEENLSDNEIVNSINNLSKQINKKNYSQYIIPWFLTTVTSIAAYWISFLITQVKDKKDFKRKCTIKYIRYLNLFIKDINLLYSNMACMEKIVIYFETILMSRLSPLINCNTNYNDFIYSINKLNKTINSFRTIDSKKVDEWNRLYDKLKDMQLFIKMGTDFDTNVVHYFYILDSEIVKNHQKIMNDLRAYSSTKINNFYPLEFKKQLMEYNRKANEIAMGEKYKLIDFK